MAQQSQSMDTLTTEDILGATQQPLEVPVSQPIPHKKEELDLKNFPKIDVMVNGELLPDTANQGPTQGDAGLMEEDHEEAERRGQRSPKRNSQQKRLDHLTWEKHQARLEADEKSQIADRLAQENAQLQRQVEQTSREALEAKEKARIYYERTLEIQNAAANDALIKAANEGNTEDYIKYNNIISKTNAQLAAYEIEKHKPQPQYQPQQPVYEQPVHEQRDPVLDRFLDENSYLKPGSPYFNPELAQEATMIESEFVKHLSVTGQQHIINTPEYYDAIGYAIRSRHDPNYGYQPQQQQNYEQENYPQRREPMVAPVNRSGGYRQADPRRMDLTDRERKVALTAGQTFKKRDGSNYSPYELERLYKHYRGNPLPNVQEQ